MSRDVFRPDYENANQFGGVDPMFGLLPIGQSVTPARGGQLDPAALRAALGLTPAGATADPNALMALIRNATPRDIQPIAAASPEFLDALRNLLTAGTARAAAGSPPATAPRGAPASPSGSPWPRRPERNARTTLLKQTIPH